jgi:hypothetical protein
LFIALIVYFRRKCTNTQEVLGFGDESVRVDYGLWIIDYRLWIMDYGLWIMDYGLWIMDYELWIMNYEL